MRTRLAATLLAAAALCAACSSAVAGVGHAGVGAGGPVTPSPARPSTPSPVAAPSGCPRVKYPAAKLTFDCLTSGMKMAYQPNNPADVWPLEAAEQVEASTGWVLNEGAGHWGPTQGNTLETIVTSIRQRMIAYDNYGAAPKVETVASKATTVDGAKAYLLQSTITLNPTWAQHDGTNVKQEKLWIVAVEVGHDDVSLWYASIPDLVKSLWAKVPAAIAAIKVG